MVEGRPGLKVRILTSTVMSRALLGAISLFPMRTPYLSQSITFMHHHFDYLLLVT